MASWYRPDPLTRDLIHLINARRHDHGDADAAIDTLQAFLDQDREQDLLTIMAALDHVAVNGDVEQRLPSCSNLSFAYVEGESLLMGISDLAVSSGSACTSASLEPSHVLRAMGLPDEQIACALRFSWCHATPDPDWAEICKRISSLL